MNVGVCAIMWHMNELTKQMLLQQQNIARQKKLDAMLADTENYKVILVRKCDTLKAELEKENADLLKLEGKSISALVYSVFGTLDQHVKKEKSEALAAKMKYDQALKDLREASDRIVRLTDERDAYTGCQQKYDELYEIKRQALLTQCSEDAGCILELEKKIGAAQISLKEIDEAKSAGQAAIAALCLALNKLNAAEGYSTWDMLGGGMIASMMKHDCIDEAADSLAAAQSRLECFRAEMGDVRLNIEISSSLYLVDMFFDNIFSDFMVHSKITDTQESVSSAIKKVKKTLDDLNQLADAKTVELDRLNDSLKQLITYS